jgi:membrane-associated protein
VSVPREGGIAGWVRRNVAHRPAATIVGARFVPGGRLVSTTAAGRYGVGLRRFLPCSLASSALWSVYMMGVGLLLGPLTAGDPLRGLAAGLVLGGLTAGVFTVADRLRSLRARSAGSRVEPVQALEPRESSVRRGEPAAV